MPRGFQGSVTDITNLTMGSESETPSWRGRSSTPRAPRRRPPVRKAHGSPGPLTTIKSIVWRLFVECGSTASAAFGFAARMPRAVHP